MGIVYQGDCPNCGYSRRFSLGGGLAGLDLHGSLRLLPSEEQAMVLELWDQGKIADFSVEQRLVWCGCRAPSERLLEKGIVTLEGFHGERRVFGCCCPVCGNGLRVYDERATEASCTVNCPCCETGTLAFRRVGFWD